MIHTQFIKHKNQTITFYFYFLHQYNTLQQFNQVVISKRVIIKDNKLVIITEP